MPGANCCLPQCSLSRKDKNVYFFKLPGKKDEFHVKWKKDLVNLLAKYRVIDIDLKDRIQKDRVFFCEHHFKTDDIEFTSKLLMI